MARALVVGVLALRLLLQCSLAGAATVNVTATGTDVFDPKTVTIAQGDTVTWKNDGLDPQGHNVDFEEFPFVMPNPASASKWTVSNTFTQPGTYHYYCQVHGYKGGIGMSGTVTVMAAAPGGGGGGGGGTPGPGPVETALVSSLSSPSTQRVHKLYVRASLNQAGTLSATGTVSVPDAAKVYRFRRVTRMVTANVPVKLRLRLSTSALRKVQHALRQREKLRARVTLTATDTAGRRTLKKQTILLKR